MTWWMAFALTQVLEVPIYLWFTRGSSLSLEWRFAVAFGASALTHPIVWFVFPVLIPHVGYIGFFVAAETFAFVVEALYFRSFEIEHPWRLSLGANAFSATTGLLLQVFSVI